MEWILKNDANSLGCAIAPAYYSARKDYKITREFPAGYGFADVVFWPLPHTGKPAMAIELKYNKTAYAAIQQIKEKHYIHGLEGYRNIVQDSFMHAGVFSAYKLDKRGRKKA